VVAGECRGRRLVSPPGSGTRPTSDRVRESMFNALGSLGAVHGATVVDLFAGSGALGIEALSRGADSAVFVESDRDACAVIAANLAACGLSGRARVVRADATTWRQAGRVDLVLADPPYVFGDWESLAARIDSEWFVAETSGPVDLGSCWDVVRTKRYGQTTVTIARRLHEA